MTRPPSGRPRTTPVARDFRILKAAHDRAVHIADEQHLRGCRLGAHHTANQAPPRHHREAILDVLLAPAIDRNGLNIGRRIAADHPNRDKLAGPERCLRPRRLRKSRFSSSSS